MRGSRKKAIERPAKEELKRLKALFGTYEPGEMFVNARRRLKRQMQKFHYTITRTAK